MHRILLLASVAVLVLGGCMSSGSNYDESKIAEISKGQTTESDLVAMFGRPSERNTDSSGAVSLQWMYTEHRTNGKSFIPIAGAFMGGADSSHKMLFVSLNPSGTVENYRSSTGGQDTRYHTQSKTANVKD